MTDNRKRPRGQIKDSSNKKPKTPASTNPIAREKKLISKAMDLAEKQLQDGTATAQVITHFLKLGTEAEKLYREKLENENSLLKAKVEALQSQQVIAELYDKALKAMREYSGSEEADFFEDDYDD